MDSGDEREVNDQIDKIDYNVEEEGMSASYYRAHDQLNQLAHQVSARSSRDMQLASSKGELTKTSGQGVQRDHHQLPPSQLTE